MTFLNKIYSKYSIHSNKIYKMSKTFETWTPEDVDFGDTDNKDFEYKDQHFDSLWQMANEIRDEGATEASSSQILPSTWWSTDQGEEDYKTGEKTYYSFHPKNLSKDEALELAKLIKMSYEEFKKQDPEVQ